MKATVDPDSAEGRAEIDRLQHQILQIYQSLRGRLRRENRASLKSQRAVLIQQLESLGMATKEQKGGSVVFTPVASGVEATIDPGIVVQSILDPRKTRKLEELTVAFSMNRAAAARGGGICYSLLLESKFRSAKRALLFLACCCMLRPHSPALGPGPGFWQIRLGTPGALLRRQHSHRA